MLRKFLFIGLGGSGGKTLRYLRHDLKQWLDQIGWKGDFPAAWQMLHIDTPTDQDGREITEVKMLPAENYLGLVMAGIDFSTVAERVASGGDETWKELAGWRVDPTFLQVPITVGAGQFRAVGRTIGLGYADRILDALQRAQMRLSSAQAGAELAEIHQLAYGTQGDTPIEPVAIVVSSLSGGTGAGLLLDTCDLLRQLPGSWASNSFGMLYASDVFRHLGDLAIAGVQPNALSALSEIMNGYWLTANDPRTSAFFKVAGAPKPLAKSGPAFPFLVGAANTKGVTFGDQKSVYAMMGRALRSWTTDPTIQVQLIEYTQANWQSSAAGNAVKADVVARDHLPVFEAFGYAEVSLGVEKLEQYASERLAKVAATWLWDAHEQHARQADKDDARPPSELVEDLARQQLVPFLQEVRLHERGESNHIIDALEPTDAKGLLDKGTNTVFQLATGGIKDLDAAGWTARIMDVVPGAVEEYVRDYDQAVREAGRAWVDSTPQLVIETITDHIAQFGLRTAARLLELVADELASVCSELTDEAEEFRRWSQDARSSVNAALGVSGRIPAHHPAVEEATATALWSSGGYQGEAKRRQVAAQLMRQFADGFIAPLATSIKFANNDLDHVGFVGNGIEPAIVGGWPDRPVPESLVPPSNEQLVIPIETFPGLYDDLLARSTSATRAGDALIEARTAVIDGRSLDETSARRAAPPITMRTTWSPDPALLLGGTTPRTAATFQTAFTPDSVLDRAKAWIHRTGTAFERFLQADLRSYLDDDDRVDPVELEQRRANFRVAFTAALDAAEPLVEIDASLLTMLHQRASVPRRAVPGQLPFRGHPIEASTREILAARLGGDAAADVAGRFTTATTIRSVSITSTLGAPHDPLVFSSITRPIVAGWTAAAQTAAGRTNFWSNRRARPLTEFIPAPQAITLAMTRGWFTGLMLGQIDRENRTISHDGEAVAFPTTLLREPVVDRDLLPSLLESLALAYVEVARTHTIDPLRPYVALRELGVTPGIASYESANMYERLNGSLDRWIRTGDAGHTLVEGILSTRLGLGEHSPTGRRTVALELVAEVRDDYRAELSTYAARARKNRQALGYAYGIWPGMAAVIDQALSDLAAALETVELEHTMVM